MESARTQNDPLTPAQRQAVAARGNVLVMAGAGTGKTRTLVARCLDCLCRERASLDEILVVTFTEAAATEMKQRLRTALEAALDPRPPTPDPHLAEQLALFDTAPIGTLHSFCLRLVREHFYELGLDPQLAVLDTGEARLLAEETLDEQFQAHYAGQTGLSAAAQNLIQIYGNGDERPVRAMLLRLHHYAQTRPDADRWLDGQITQFASPEPVEWREWLNQAIRDWRAEWLAALDGLKPENEKAGRCLEILKNLPADPSPKQAGMVLGEILSADEDYPARKKNALRKPLEVFFADAAFLHSLMPADGNRDPLAEDWGWIRGHMTTLLQLAQEFGERFAEGKRAGGVLDFHDLEQFALKLLWDFTADQPTPVAGRWREKIRFVLVDEYQDINAAQDKIIQALSRTGAAANRFLVGDVKQSIYRFRLADPKIFRDYAGSWHGRQGQLIPLAENFRSRESLLGFVNSFFERLMRGEVGGVDYDAGTRLQFGAPEHRAVLSRAQNPSPRAELLLRFKGRRDENPADDDTGDGDLAELEESEKEARLVAHRLRELVEQGHNVWDEKQGAERAVEWRDMAVLLRAPANKAEAYANEFERAGLPIATEHGGFYDKVEIADLLNLLKLLDNPLQDVPAIAVLRSPLAGLSLDELATLRLAARDAHFWTALNQAQSPSAFARPRRDEKFKVQSETAAKISNLLERFSRWRQLARRASLSQCLESILAGTHYAGWLRSRPRGAQRQANIERFLDLAQQFDQFQRQGLSRFLKFIQAQQAAGAEPDVAAVATENAVRLMSIHQSKGLEFPVVVVADLGKPFNEQDLRSEIILDGRLGLCPRVKPPSTGSRYPSLPHWLAQRHQRRELRGEELRLLYVAMTRARDTLILTAAISEKKWESLWLKPETVTTQAIVSAKCYADWLGLWFQSQRAGLQTQSMTEGEWPDLRWRIVEDRARALESAIESRPSEIEIPPLDLETKQRLHDVLAWKYPFGAATQRPAKSSVTALRRQAEEGDDEAEPMFQISSRVTGPPSAIRHPQLTAAETGTAHHKLLQHVTLKTADDLAALGVDARHLEAMGRLTAGERAALDLDAVAAFWKSEPGRKIRAQPPECVQRELPFTARFSPAEVDAIIGAKTPPALEDEFVVVQGVADLVVLLPGEIWLVDFKTDELEPGESSERKRHYEPQLKLYAGALSRIYARPVANCWLHFLATRQTVAIRI
ncbi:MAG TPA: UvrD-helicase domain-containing protein [Verrucomicrobiae bacterium]|nr:UvrD-helicase domain-containing protein [Verrucomicrobiae bacterium]